MIVFSSSSIFDEFLTIIINSSSKREVAILLIISKCKVPSCLVGTNNAKYFGPVCHQKSPTQLDEVISNKEQWASLCNLL
mgnify:CR=1 FL=1